MTNTVDFTGLQNAVDKACATIDQLREEKHEAISLLIRCVDAFCLPDGLEAEVTEFLAHIARGKP